MSKNTRKELLAQLRAATEEHLNELNLERELAVEKMQSLGAREDAETRNILLGYLTQTENDLLRPLAASRLSEIGGKDVTLELIDLLDNVDDSEICVLIVQILAEIADAEASPALVKVLQDGTFIEARRRAAFALGKTGGENVYEALMSALDTEDHVKIRQQLVGALGWLGDVRCIPDLVQIMETDPDKETRTFAAEALGRIGSERCYEPLLDTLQNRDGLPIVRYYAAHALGLLADERAIQPLETIVNDSFRTCLGFSNGIRSPGTFCLI